MNYYILGVALWVGLIGCCYKNKGATHTTFQVKSGPCFPSSKNQLKIWYFSFCWLVVIKLLYNWLKQARGTHDSSCVVNHFIAWIVFQSNIWFFSAEFCLILLLTFYFLAWLSAPVAIPTRFVIAEVIQVGLWPCRHNKTEIFELYFYYFLSYHTAVTRFWVFLIQVYIWTVCLAIWSCIYRWIAKYNEIVGSAL